MEEWERGEDAEDSSDFPTASIQFTGFLCETFRPELDL